MRGLLPIFPSGTMIAAAPKQGFLSGGWVNKNKKNYLPAVPRRGPEAGVLRKVKFSWFGSEPDQFMPVSPQQFFFSSAGKRARS